MRIKPTAIDSLERLICDTQSPSLYCAIKEPLRSGCIDDSMSAKDIGGYVSYSGQVHSFDGKPLCQSPGLMNNQSNTDRSRSRRELSSWQSAERSSPIYCVGMAAAGALVGCILGPIVHAYSNGNLYLHMIYATGGVAAGSLFSISAGDFKIPEPKNPDYQFAVTWGATIGLYAGNFKMPYDHLSKTPELGAAFLGTIALTTVIGLLAGTLFGYAQSHGFFATSHSR